MRRRHLSLLAIPALAGAGLAILLIPKSAGPGPQLTAPDIFTPKPAPAFRLPDQYGKLTSLAQFRGMPVVVTFVESQCVELCPLVMDDITAAAKNLRSGGGRAALVAISTDPEADTRTTVGAFLQRHGGVSRWHYLSDARALLEPVWKSYYVYAAPARAPAKIRDAHTSATYLVDPQGRWRGLFVGAFDPRTLARDLRILDGLPAQPSSHIEVAAQPGAQAPAFSLPALNGGTVRLSQYAGKVVLVNVWATWCLPCRQEMPLLQSTYRRERNRGLVIVGIDRQEDRVSVRTFVSRARVTYPIALDSGGSVTTRYIEACPKLGGIPDSILVDGSGTVAAVSCGQVDGRWLSQNVDKLLGLPYRG